MTSQSFTTQVKKWSYQTCSLDSVPGQAQTFHWILLSTMPDDKEAFQQAFVNDPEMQALANLIITGWPEDIKEVPHPPTSILATPRNPHHWGWPIPVRWSPCHSSCQKGESPASTASIPSRNNEVTVAHMWSFFWPSINKAIEEVVCQCETCTWFQSQNAAAPLTPTPTPSCPCVPQISSC